MFPFPRSIAPGLPIAIFLGILLVQCRTPPPTTGGSGVTSERLAAVNFVDVALSLPSIRRDLRYATPQNVSRAPIYPVDMPCLVHASTARKLARVQAELEARGLSLKIWDAYRPPIAQWVLYDAWPDKTYVVPPTESTSRHSMGCAVDVTLVDRFGNELRMPTGFDDFRTSAASQYIGSDPEIRRNLDILQNAMKSAGFNTIRSEWWHFWDPDAPVQAILASQLGIEFPPYIQRNYRDIVRDVRRS